MYSACLSIKPTSTLRLKFVSEISIFKADDRAEKYHYKSSLKTTYAQYSRQENFN